VKPRQPVKRPPELAPTEAAPGIGAYLGVAFRDPARAGSGCRVADEGRDEDHGGRQYLWLKAASGASGGSRLAAGRVIGLSAVP
jgi:hypothetical protein